jgi:hypothetical protein
MEEIQFLSCDLEQVQLESSNSRQAHQVPLLAEGLRQVQREFQNQDDAKKVADLKMPQDQKINEEKEVSSNFDFSYHSLLLADYCATK